MGFQNSDFKILRKENLKSLLETQEHLNETVKILLISPIYDKVGKRARRHHRLLSSPRDPGSLFHFLYL